MAASPSPVVVIGAGIVGACVASWLQRDGRDVMLIDAEEPGAAASSGNGGMLSGSSIVPVAMPGVAAKVPGWLMDAEGPLTLRWSYLPQMLPWLWRFIRSATPGKVEAQARALRALLAGSLYTLVTRSSNEPDRVTSRDWFWVTLGTSLFFAFRMALPPFVELMLSTNRELTRLAYVVSAWADILAYILIARGMVCPLPQARSGGSS